MLAATWRWRRPITALALPGYRYGFPRDHFNHAEFRTEWWYWTGNLRTADGRRFGFELTFFRQGVDRRSDRAGRVGRARCLARAPGAQRYRRRPLLPRERLNRAGPGLAGADLAQARVWNGNWQVRWRLDAAAPGGVAGQRLEAVAERFRFALDLRPQKPPVIHGVNGVSQKAAGEGRASHYVSFTRLAGGRRSRDRRAALRGGGPGVDGPRVLHPSARSPRQSGWDWFSLQFDDGAELMLFRLRRKDGTADPYSAGTYVDPRGRARHLAARSLR